LIKFSAISISSELALGEVSSAPGPVDEFEESIDNSALSTESGDMSWCPCSSTSCGSESVKGISEAAGGDWSVFAAVVA
jgi:hypothetical protein